MVNTPLTERAEESRFQVLLTRDRRVGQEHWTGQLSRLLEPQGVVAHVADSGRQAMDLAGRLEIHAAVVDMATPLEDGGGGQASALNEPAEVWLLELFRRLPHRPPVVIVHSTDYSQRRLDRLLRQALRMGAFSVLNKPVELEAILGVFQRLVEREYSGYWPRS